MPTQALTAWSNRGERVLTGENSCCQHVSWTTSRAGHPLITNATGMVAIFNASVAGTYVVNLSVNGGASSKNVTITVDDNFPDPLEHQVRAGEERAAEHLSQRYVSAMHKLPHAHGQCCRRHARSAIWYTDFDRNGSGGAADSTTTRGSSRLCRGA